MRASSRARRALVVGVGNPLFGENGFGVAVLERLASDEAVREAADLVDGGCNLLALPSRRLDCGSWRSGCARSGWEQRGPRGPRSRPGRSACAS
jgi:hypothetical protein